jgi:hypothetical protein
MTQRHPLISPAALFAALALAPAAGAQYSSASGQYFSSAGAAYMNTLSWSSMSRSPEMREAEARAYANGRQNSSPAAPSQDANAAARALAAAEFRPIAEERARAVESVVAQLPAGFRDKQRMRIETLSPVVEKALGAHKNNLAEVTYVLIGLSMQTASGKPIETAKAEQLVRAIALAYAGDEGFKRLDDRGRSRMYYLYTSLIALQGGLGLSKDPAETEVAKALARGTLHEFGIQP